MLTECHLDGGNDQFRLNPGENLVGRNSDAPVHIDAASVSRRHARIDVDGDRAHLRDLGSKNGTFARGQRVEGVVDLFDGDAIRVGDVWLIFRSGAAAGNGTSRD
jgi:pSer/pThr/pTyr-binding forkhead associated (FHA) protein